MKPNIAFLRKVEAGEVMLVFSYSAKHGGKHKFYGGETTAKLHRKAGFIMMKDFADLGRPSVASLTETGRAALASALVS